MADVAPAQVATRRRAVGRLLAKQADALPGWDLFPIADKQFLSKAELDAIDKQVKALAAVAGNLRKIGAKLDQS